MNFQTLLADAKFSKNHIEDVLDIDTAQQPSQRISGRSEFLGDQLLTVPGHAQATLQRIAGRNKTRCRSRPISASSAAPK
jgi:hypothetical protein